MNTEYHVWHSPNLGREMPLEVYGHAGKPLLIFPCAGGRFFEAEDFGMIHALRDFIGTGKIQVFTVDSLDHESWLAHWKWPGDRAWRHEQYDRYIVQEVAPFIRQHSGWAGKFMATGNSLGAYHAANSLFRHPDWFDVTIALSGLYSPHHFVGEYRDEHVYFNFPLLYLSNLDDPAYLEQFRQSRIIVCVGQGAWEEIPLAETRALEGVLWALDVPAWFDYWGYDVNHDWPWWRRQLPYFLSMLAL